MDKEKMRETDFDKLTVPGLTREQVMLIVTCPYERPRLAADVREKQLLARLRTYGFVERSPEKLYRATDQGARLAQHYARKGWLGDIAKKYWQLVGISSIEVAL